MFVVKRISGGNCYFELPDISNYSCVCLVKSTLALPKPDALDDNFDLLSEIQEERIIKQPSYLLGDFVVHSSLNNSKCGLIGIPGVRQEYYVALNVTRSTLGIKLVDSNLDLADVNEAELVLHFKVDK